MAIDDIKKELEERFAEPLDEEVKVMAEKSLDRMLELAK